jgi:3-oxoadipate enol-lactonase
VIKQSVTGTRECRVDGPRQERRTLVLLHAAGHGPQLWQPQMDALGQEFDLLVPDLGDTRPDRRFTIAGAAEAVAELITSRPGGSAAVCGLSLGAFVALELAARHPERVQALVLSGGQLRPRRVLLGLNYALLNVLPHKIVVPGGGSRRTTLASYRTLFTWDGRALAGRVRAPSCATSTGPDTFGTPRTRTCSTKSCATSCPAYRPPPTPRRDHARGRRRPLRVTATCMITPGWREGTRAVRSPRCRRTWSRGTPRSPRNRPHARTRSA